MAKRRITIGGFGGVQENFGGETAGGKQLVIRSGTVLDGIKIGEISAGGTGGSETINTILPSDGTITLYTVSSCVFQSSTVVSFLEFSVAGRRYIAGNTLEPKILDAPKGVRAKIVAVSAGKYLDSITFDILETVAPSSPIEKVVVPEIPSTSNIPLRRTVAIRSISGRKFLDGRSGERNPLLTNGFPNGNKFLNWVIVPLEEGIYAIKSISSESYLDGGYGQAEPLLTKGSPENAANLKWKIENATTGLFAIQSVSSGRYLDGRTSSDAEPLLAARSPARDNTLHWQIEIADDYNPNLLKILENNRKWVSQMKEKDPHFFDDLAKPQKPKYLYFGCADSRVPANEILGLGPGEVFVHRNIGNLVPGNDLSALSVLEYAVTHLHVTDIIVTGHYDCGAVRAATKRQDLGLLEHWLRLIRDVHRTYKEQLDLISDSEQMHQRLVELNVIEQCLNLFKTGVVQRKRNETRKQLLEQQAKNPVSGFNIEDEVYPRIYGTVFNPADGQLKKLTVDFGQRVGKLDHIYGLYKSDEGTAAPDEHKH